MEEVVTVNNLADVKPKDHYTGKIVKIMLAGAVVDIGLEVPGVVHISQLREDPVNRVEDVVEVGKVVDVWVKRVLPKKNRIELTMIKPLLLDWRDLSDGLVVKGKVTRLEKYGAFVEIGAERPGLVHISELGYGFIRTPGDAVSEGDEVDVKVLAVDRRKKQIRLSMKALMDDPAKLLAEVAKEEKKEKEKEKNTDEEANEKPVPTAMEMAMRAAYTRSQEERKDTPQPKGGKKPGAPAKNELENILARTLQNKAKTTSK